MLYLDLDLVNPNDMDNIDIIEPTMDKKEQDDEDELGKTATDDTIDVPAPQQLQKSEPQEQ